MGLRWILDHSPERLLFPLFIWRWLVDTRAACHICRTDGFLCRSPRQSKAAVMKILILGATGGTGIELVRRSLEAGHSVTAFVRKPESLTSFYGQIKIMAGNLLDASALTSV